MTSTSTADKATITSTSTADKATITSRELIFNSPEKCRLRKRIEYLKNNYKSKIRSFQQYLRRKNTQVATLKYVLNHLQKKNMLDNEQVEVLQALGESKGDIFKQLMKLKCVPRKYDETLHSFALILHFYSPRAYEYVRSKFNSYLPHVKTISKWYGNIEGKPSINLEALTCIKQRVNTTGYALLGALIFDEMAIRQHVEYDGTKFSGYIDMGDNIACNDNILASEALVFMIVCINGAWKIPIAYFLINKINAEQKSNLALQCISAVHNAGMRVVSVTCDGMNTNLSTLKHLGCNFNDITSLQTWFPHPDTQEKIFVFLDPCHMLKLIRNIIGDMKQMVDRNGHVIRWSDLVQLNELQQQESMHLANKLRSARIQYHNQIMKVRLTFQIFSTAVANALLFCKNTLKLQEFESCQGTIDFLRAFNDLFDILNSKNMKQSEFKQPLNEENKEIIINKLDEIKNYILSLNTVNGELLIKSRKKTGFFGFLICINSMIALYEEICEQKKLLKYIPIYKLSQGHIELLFGCIRRQGGNNNNPTSRQFKAALKKILTHAEVRDVHTGNCIPLEHISILHISSANKISNSKDIINMSTRLSQIVTDMFEDIHTNESEDELQFIYDHNYLPDVRDISEFSLN